MFGLPNIGSKDKGSKHITQVSARESFLVTELILRDNSGEYTSSFVPQLYFNTDLGILNSEVTIALIPNEFVDLDRLKRESLRLAFK
jgi:hypothetical protein